MKAGAEFIFVIYLYFINIGTSLSFDTLASEQENEPLKNNKTEY